MYPRRRPLRRPAAAATHSAACSSQCLAAAAAALLQEVVLPLHPHKVLQGPSPPPAAVSVLHRTLVSDRGFVPRVLDVKFNLGNPHFVSVGWRAALFCPCLAQLPHCKPLPGCSKHIRDSCCGGCCCRRLGAAGGGRPHAALAVTCQFWHSFWCNLSAQHARSFDCMRPSQ